MVLVKEERRPKMVLTYREFQIIVRFEDGVQKEFTLLAVDLDSALLDISEAYRMSCACVGMLKGL